MSGAARVHPREAEGEAGRGGEPSDRGSLVHSPFLRPAHRSDTKGTRWRVIRLLPERFPLVYLTSVRR